MSQPELDPRLLERFLAGNCSDKEFRLVESMLEDPDTVVELANQESRDTIVRDLKSLANQPGPLEIEDPEVSALIRKVHALVPCPEISRDTLEQVLEAPQTPDEIGSISGYSVIEFMASGGMGLVFKARDPRLDRLVCIKILHPSIARQPAARQRFERETRAAARLRHDRIITILDVGEHRGLPFLVMQLLDGASLAQILHRDGTLTPEQSVRYARQIAEGLDYAHSLGILHRDIKPDNIWITEQDEVRLLDFGLARAVHDSSDLTNSGTVLGTPSYMSPEQVQGQELDQRSDLFSLGTVLFEMLTGKCPFSRANLFSTMMSVATDSLAVEELDEQNRIPQTLEPVVRKLLEKDPANRFQSATEFLDALDGHGPTHTVASPTGLGAGHRLRTGMIGALGAAALILFSFLIYKTTDKGTLVIKADPSIELEMRDESLTIHDPVSERNWKISIGNQPLPSGVYQLELQDDSGQFTLSSQTVTIRRGSQTIVTVELKPDIEVSGSQRDNGQSGLAIEKLDLDTLPLLAGEQLPAFMKPQGFARNALVQNAIANDEFEAYTIEPARIATAWSAPMAINRDGTRIATGDSLGFIRIWNSRFELLQILPGPGNVAQLRWAPHHDLLAAIYTEESSETVIWKILERESGVIDTIPGNATDIAWSHSGARIALAGSSGISFYHLSDGQVSVLPNHAIEGAIGQRPWSQDGRFLATTESWTEDPSQPQNKSWRVKIWNTSNGQVHHQFNRAAGAEWIPDSNDLMIERESPSAVMLESWDMEKLTRRDALSTADLGLSYVVRSMDGKRLAQLDSEGVLLIKQINSAGTAASVILRLDLVQYFGKEIRLGYGGGFGRPEKRIHWSGDGQHLLVHVGQLVITGDINDENSWFAFDKLSVDRWQVKYRLNAFSIGGQLRQADYFVKDRMIQLEVTYPDSQQGGTSESVLGTPIDIADGKTGPQRLHFRESPYPTLTLASGETLTTRFVSRTSHDLEWMLSTSEPVLSEDQSNLETMLHLHRVMSDDAVMEFPVDGMVSEILWCPDNQFFIVGVYSPATKQSAVQILDPATNSLRQPAFDLSSPEDRVVGTGLMTTSNGTLLLPTWTQTGSRRSRSSLKSDAKVRRFNLAALQELEPVELGNLYALEQPLVGKDLVLMGVDARDLEKGRGTINSVVYEIRKDGQVVQLKWNNPEFPDLSDHLNDNRSPYVVRLNSVSRTGRFAVIAVSAKSGSLMEYQVYRVGRDGTCTLLHKFQWKGTRWVNRPLDWHVDSPQLAVLQDETLEIFDPVNGQLKTISGLGNLAHAGVSSSGPYWLVAESRGLIVLDQDGQRVGTILNSAGWVLPAENTPEMPIPDWITGEGEMAFGNVERQLRAVAIRNDRVVTLPISEFEAAAGLKLRQASFPPCPLEPEIP